jgi:GDP-L-fucose synthase
MRILITGANGYIGKSLHTALKDKHDVTVLTRNSFDLTDVLAMSKFFLSRQNFDAVIHCAIAGARDPRSSDWTIMDRNLSMYYNLLQFRTHYTRLIHFGSGAETYLPSTPYGYSKKVIAKSILNQDNFYNLKIFGVFDKNELDTRFIKASILRYIKKEPIQIHENKFMDFFYMQDLISVVEYYIGEKEPHKEFDCVYHESFYSLYGIATVISELDNYKVEVVYGDRMGDDYVSKYRNKLPIEFIGLQEGIKRTYCKLKQEKL